MIIAIQGKKNAGKSTAVEIIARDLLPPRPSREIAFAETFKPFVGNLLGFDEEQLYGPSEKREELIEFDGDRFYNRARANVQLQLTRWGREIGADLYGKAIMPFWRWTDTLTQLAKTLEGKISARLALQTFGTEFGRQVHPDLWVNITISRAGRYLHESPRGVVLISDCRFDNEVRCVREAGGVVLRIVNVEAVETRDAHASERQELSELPNAVIHNRPSAGRESLRQDLRAALSGVI